MTTSSHSYKSKGFQKYLGNTLWMFLTYGLRLFTGFFVGLWLARYLGPSSYGIYNYIISLTTIFITIGMFGTPEILVKKILDSNGAPKVALSSGFNLRLILSLFLFFALVAYSYFEESSEVQNYIIISAFAIFFQPFEVVDSFFRAKVLAKKSSIGRMVQLVLSAILKILLIVYKAPLVWFYLVFVLDGLFYSALILISYLKENPGFFSFKFDFTLMKEIARESLPLMIIAVTSLMLNRFDLVIIGNLLTKADVGFYSAASKTVEIGGLFATLISLSLFPAILHAKKSDKELYLKRMAMLNRLLVAGGGVLTLIVFIFAGPIIKVLFGEQYSSSGNILKMLSFNLLFVSFYQVSFRWYLSENLQKLMMIKTLIAVGVNITLNFILIPMYGIMGSAIASIVSGFIFYFLFEAFFERTRECFRINTSFLRF